MTALQRKVMAFVHDSPLLADMVYWAAHIFSCVKSRIGPAWASVSKAEGLKLVDQLRLPISESLHLTTTNVCNARCIFCAYPKVINTTDRPTRTMPMDLFKTVVDQYDATGGSSVNFTPTLGDVLLDPFLLDRIKYIRKKARRYHIGLYTNGILLDHDEMYKSLLDLEVDDISVCMSACDKEQYREVYGVDAYEKVLQGVRKMLSYNATLAHPIKIQIRFRNAEKPSRIIRSEDYRRYIRPFLSDHVAINFTVDFDNWCGNISSSDLKGVMKMKPFVRNMLTPCNGLFYVGVLSDGSLRMCGCRIKESENDSLVIGNVNTDTLQDIASSSRAQDIVKAFWEGDLPQVCEQCSFYRPVPRKKFLSSLSQADKPKRG